MATPARVLVCTGPGQVVLEERILPAPGPGQVLVQSRVSLVSTGTELTTVRGNWPEGAYWREITRYPGDLGYSLVGTVAQVGPGIDLAPGQRVFAAAPHGSAALLTVQRPPLERPNVLPIPPEVSDEAAAFLALALVALNAVRLARIELGETVAVVGLGVIGQLACRLARPAGARRVLAFGHRSGHLAAARAGGVIAALDPRSAVDPQEALRAHNRGALADVVLECSGSASAIALALRLARRNGRVVLAGSPAGPVSLELHPTVHGQGIQLIGAHTSTLPFGELPLQPGWSVERATTLFWDLLADGTLDVTPLISDRVKGADAPALYQRLLADRGDGLGVVLRWDEMGDANSPDDESSGYHYKAP